MDGEGFATNGGRTVNVISLAGIAFAIGMTLDNGIVVLESIEHQRRKGLDRLRAAIEGTGTGAHVRPCTEHLAGPGEDYRPNGVILVASPVGLAEPLDDGHGHTVVCLRPVQGDHGDAVGRFESGTRVKIRRHRQFSEFLHREHSLMTQVVDREHRPCLETEGPSRWAERHAMDSGQSG